MQGPLAQIVALNCHANAYWAGKPIEPFFPGNSTCQFCEYVHFVEFKKDLHGEVEEVAIADTPEAWFTHLKTCGVIGIRLFCVPQNEPDCADRTTEGVVGGGGKWVMEALLPSESSEFWIARWEAHNPKAPDKRGWRVKYGQVAKARTNPLTLPDLKVTTHELVESLKEIRAFSIRQKIDFFTSWFDEALETIESQGRTRHGYHQDLAPKGFLCDEAAMLLDACQKAWVFGGEGSWNDMSFEGEAQQIYERVSERLYQAVKSAIADAATSSLRAPKKMKRIPDFIRKIDGFFRKSCI